METYAELTKEFLPSPTLEKAVGYVKDRSRAIDLGAGSLRNSIYLLDQGFTVIAIDKQKIVSELAGNSKNGRLSVEICDMKDYHFPLNTFDLVVAVRSLPFLSREYFFKVLESIKDSLRSKGVLYVTFFGDKDEWNGSPDKTFLSEEQIKDLFSDMELLHLKEVEKDGKTIRGRDKHWHTFEVIVRKK